MIKRVGKQIRRDMCKILVTDHPVENRKKNFVKDVIEIQIPKEGAPQYIYRADTRAKEVIKAKGFEAKHPQTLEDAKAEIIEIFCNGKNIMAQWVSGGADSMNNKWISTADERGCMGYSTKRNVYVISIPELREVKTCDENVFGTKPNNKQIYRLYLNADTLKEATIIGVRPSERSREIVFFTAIEARFVIGLMCDADNCEKI